jgi:hypothetical protein
MARIEMDNGIPEIQSIVCIAFIAFGQSASLALLTQE